MSSTHHGILYQLPTFHLMTGSSRHQLPRTVGKDIFDGFLKGLKSNFEVVFSHCDASKFHKGLTVGWLFIHVPFSDGMIF